MPRVRLVRLVPGQRAGPGQHPQAVRRRRLPAEIERELKPTAPFGVVRVLLPERPERTGQTRQSHPVAALD